MRVMGWCVKCHKVKWVRSRFGEPHGLCDECEDQR